MFSNITSLAFQPEIWLIFGLVLLLLELTDGSAIFFLPMAIGAALLAVWIYLFNASFIPSGWLSANWYVTFLLWACLSFGAAIMISNAKKRRRLSKKSEEGDDVNDY
ncbi:MAG: hypothetical protein ACON44_00655 [Candidatus Puniceispirillaceae bacterium]